jgi:hypothetical protein
MIFKNKIKSYIYKFDDLAGFFFLPLIILSLVLFYFEYFNLLQFIWIEIFLIIGWLVYIYRYFKDSQDQK